MPSTTNLEENSMEGSPLMNPKQTPLHSSINPEKLDQSRFSEMRNLDEEKTSPVRIIIYAVIIILLGVAAAFLVRTLIANNQQEPTDTQETVLEEDNNTEPVSAYAVSLTAKNDSAATNVGANDEYVDSETVTLGVTTLDMTKVELAKINYDKYTTFARVKFDFEGNTNKTPKTTINFANNNLEVSFLGLTKIAEDLLADKSINDLVSSISYDSETSMFVLVFSSDSKYRVSQSQGDLIIDVKTLKELEKPETQTPVAEEPEVDEPVANTDSNTDTSKPAAPYYKNEFSQKKQFISSNVKTNSLGFNNYWYWDQDSFFEFSLGQTNVVGEENTPNATAYLAKEDGVDYLYLEIENLSNAPFSQSKTKTLAELTASNVSPDKVNFVKIDLVSFESGKATYKIQLKNKADYKLLSQLTADESTQILSLQIKD